MEVYLDNSATTKVRTEVLEQIIDVNKNFYGNPSSLHRMGLQIEKKIQEARKAAAKIINSSAEEIYFTSGGTEGNNIAILSYLANADNNQNVITTKIEHPSVYNIFDKLKDKVEVRYVNVDVQGRIDLNNLKELIDDNTRLISIMHVNNEIGIIQDIEQIVAIVKEKNKNTKIHIDAVQSYGKIKIDLAKIAIDSLVFSSHKIHGPKGVGGLFVRSKLKLNPTAFGGGQEKSIRPGTENTAGIVGFGQACELVYMNFKEEVQRLINLRNLYAKRLLEEIDDIKINSILNEEGAAHILSVSFKNVKGEVLLHYLEQKNIYISTGSACSSKSKNNRILEAVKLDKEYIDGTIRMSLGYFNSIDEVEYVVDAIKKSVIDIRKIMM